MQNELIRVALRILLNTCVILGNIVAYVNYPTLYRVTAPERTPHHSLSVVECCSKSQTYPGFSLFETTPPHRDLPSIIKCHIETQWNILHTTVHYRLYTEASKTTLGNYILVLLTGGASLVKLVGKGFSLQAARQEAGPSASRAIGNGARNMSRSPVVS